MTPMTDPTQAPQFETKDAGFATRAPEVKDADDVVVEHQEHEDDDQEGNRR